MADKNYNVMSQVYTTKELGELAEKMALNRIKFLKSIGMGYGYAGNQEKATKNEQTAFNMLADKYLGHLRSGFYNDLNEKKVRDGIYSVDDLWQMAEGKYSPKEIDDVKLASKIENWMDLSTEDIAKLATEVGYDFGDDAQRKEFMGKLAEFKIASDRAKNLKEWDNSTAGVIMRVLFPTASEEGRRAIATGEGGDASSIRNAMLVDGAVNAAVLMAPGVSAGVAGRLAPVAKVANVAERGLGKVTPNVVRQIKTVPELGNFYGASKQALAEGGREMAQKHLQLGDREASLDAPTTVLEIGATIPNLAALPARFINSSNVQSKNLRNFGRGVAMSNRYGNPVTVEAGEINANLKNLGKYEDLAEMTPDQVLKRDMARQASKRVDVLKKSLEHEGKVFDPNDLEGSLNAYSGRIRYANGQPNADDVAVWDAFKNAFPQKAADLEQRGGARTVGYVVGNVANDVGGRIEPAFRVGSGYYNGDFGKADYRETDWYRKLSKAQKKVVDESYKEKVKLLADEEPQ